MSPDAMSIRLHLRRVRVVAVVIDVIEVLEANANREPDGAGILVVVLVRRLAE